MAKTSESFCGSSSTHYYPAAQQFPRTIYIFACVIIVLGSVTATVGNTMILFALRKCQSLHSPSKVLLCSLVLTDLIVGLVVLPLFTAYYLTIILEMPKYYCTIAVTFGRTASFVVGVSLTTITTISIDRYLAFHLLLRYRQLVTVKRVVAVLVIEWILAAFWTGSWFWSPKINVLTGSIVLFSSLLITSLCYINIYRGLRRYVAHRQRNANEAGNFNVIQYKRSVNNMLGIYVVFLVCYTPTFSSQLTIVVLGLNNSTRFALHFVAIAIHLNSSLNPFLYCWRIKELKENVLTNLCFIYHSLRNTT